MNMLDLKLSFILNDVHVMMNECDIKIFTQSKLGINSE